MKDKISKRRPWLAGILSFFLPGLGHIYVGYLKQGLILYCLCVVIGITSSMTMLFPQLYPFNLIFVLLINLGIYIYVIVQASSYARTLPEDYKLKPFNRWYFYLIIVLISGFLIRPSLITPLKNNLIESYIVPTRAMANTIKAGDFIIGDKRKNIKNAVKQGDIIIFKYPRDPHLKYVKRCIAEPGDTLKIVNRKVYVNGIEFELPEHGRFIRPMADPRKRDPNIFLGKGNKDNFSQLVIPKKGDRIKIEPESALLVKQLMLFDGHKLTLINENHEYEFTMIDPTDLYRRKNSNEVFDDYYPNGNLINPWTTNMPKGELFFDGQPIMDIDEYIVEQNYFWVMGDNRDNSLDSRFWGFVPQNYIVGKPLYIYLSVDLNTWSMRFSRMGNKLN